MLGLGTLVKHEMKAVGRRLLPFYGALIVVTVFFGLAVFGIGPEGVFGGILSGLTGILYAIMAVGVIVYTAIVLIQRFYSNLLGNEGYLHFTLPVGTNAHIANKVISAGVWVMLSIIAAGISVLILMLFAVTPPELMGELKVVLSEINDYVGGIEIAVAILEVMVLGFLAFGEAAVKVYAAISMGQLLENHRALGAIGSYVGFCIIECIVAGIMDKIIPMYQLFNMDISAFAIFQLEMLGTFLVTALLMAIYWFISHRILDRRLNLQ
ncbi:MAG: hypothetical protein ACI4KL_05965 [Lentihominibacter sp.]